MKGAFQKGAISGASHAFFNLVYPPNCPGVYRRIYVSESPFVGWKLAVRMHIPFAKEQSELLLGEIGIDLGQWDAMKCKVPRRVPGIFPLVGHRDDVGVVKIAPFVIPALFSTLRGRRPGRIAVQPGTHIEVIKLFRP